MPRRPSESDKRVQVMPLTSFGRLEPGLVGTTLYFHHLLQAHKYCCCRAYSLPDMMEDRGEKRRESRSAYVDLSDPG
jgi:hypothetical protein